MPENGDRLDLALNLAKESLQGAGETQGQIVVFAADVDQNFAKALKSVEQAVAQGYEVNVVNVNAQNNQKLQKIADHGEGIYVGVSQIKKLTQKVNQQISHEMKKSQNKISQWLDAGYYLCFIPLLGCLYLFRRGILCLLLLMASAASAQAGFFLNADQEGMLAYNQENYAAAAKAFKTPAWQASSYYRLGDYAQAYRNFSQTDDIESLYNQGNALAKMGKIDEAIKKYEQVLAQSPEHEDAKFNLEYLKQQQNQPQSSSGQSDQNQDKEQQQDQQKSEASQSSEQQDDSKPQDNPNDTEQSQTSEQQESKSSQQQDNQDEQQNTSGMQQQKVANTPQEKQQDQPQKNDSTPLQTGSDDHTYTEEAQARELQYREIPEDPGGLLRAFIAREYEKNRYAKDK